MIKKLWQRILRWFLEWPAPGQIQPVRCTYPNKARQPVTVAKMKRDARKRRNVEKRGK
jgi:hypothetical protein